MRGLKRRRFDAPNRASRSLPSPTAADLEDPLFHAIFNVIRGWDVRPSDESGYCGANGSHVMLILKAVREELVLELAIIGAHQIKDER